MKPVTPKSVLRIERGKWFYDGRELTKGEIDNLKAEAEMITKTKLWKILVNRAKYHAQIRAITAKDDKALKQVQEFYNVVISFEELIKSISSHS